ncbi:hypothetical protein BABINDRAFT_24540, partial [Babjeviella inositovora NRRL Y-12698]
LPALLRLASATVRAVEDGTTYIVCSTAARLAAAFRAKAAALQVLSVGVHLDMDVAARDILAVCLQNTATLASPELGPAVFAFGAMLALKAPVVGPLLASALASLVVSPASRATVAHCARTMSLAFRTLPEDVVVSVVYAVNNLCTPDARDARGFSSEGSVRSLATSAFSSARGASKDTTDTGTVQEKAVTALATIARHFADELISTLVVTILSQKLKTATGTDPVIVAGLAQCAPYIPERELQVILKTYNGLLLASAKRGDETMARTVVAARVDIARNIAPTNPLFWPYLREILTSIVARGDVQELEHHRSHVEISEVGRQIAYYLAPLAALLPDVGAPPLEVTDLKTINLFKNAWFNMVVHGYTETSVAPATRTHLERIAYNSPPLASEASWEGNETSLELNTVLRRGSSNHNVKDQKQRLGLFESKLSFHTISYPNLVFLSASLLLESLRVRSGSCSQTLVYFSDPSVENSDLGKYIKDLALSVVRKYVNLVNGSSSRFTGERVAEQLTAMLVLCLHRLPAVQDAALQCCSYLIKCIPSALCHSQSLSTLLDILTVGFEAVVDSDTSQYDPRTEFTSKTAGLRFQVPNSVAWRRDTLAVLQKHAREWVLLAMGCANHDMKNLLQNYVATGRARALELGTSFAMQMAATVLPCDRELYHIRHMQFDTASGFLAQVRWKSGFNNALMENVAGTDANGVVALDTSRGEPFNARAFKDKARACVSALHALVARGEPIAETQVLAALESCAAVLSLLRHDNAEFIRYVVDLPFAIFTANVFKVATNVWLSIMTDLPAVAVLLLGDVITRWEQTVYERKGLYSTAHDMPDPAYTSMEYAPSSKEVIQHHLRVTAELLEPHTYVIRMLASHFQATKYLSGHLLALFEQFCMTAMRAADSASYHPLARLPRFELAALCIDVLKYHVRLGLPHPSEFMAAILAGGLSWFKTPPVWPAGGNTLQMRADHGVLRNVATALSNFTLHARSAETQRQLLLLFLDDEISNLATWMDPLSLTETRGTYAAPVSEAAVTDAFRVDPVLALRLVARAKKHQSVLRGLVTRDPAHCMVYADALAYALNGVMPYQVLFWRRIAPIDAINLFLPPRGDDPFVLQYTTRVLESYDVNLTFFYVPQIVQTLRHDARGYVERFILETASVSGLFAHQIIWNMLANSYKDEESTVPDAIKPTLDRVQQKMTAAFTPEALDFYRREFGFFNEVTEISGKLKPYIKKLKAEKKVKIDEEMAKIAVARDAYLPSNPDGVVVDINRTSGKPLQSHAKAPFMATFKIRKEAVDVETGATLQIEKWQSAIFKVGDDCRQDVLALQLISVFRTIWATAGLDLYVFPYRVTATAPGCGVIDVLPNSVSRDMLGREAVNGLYEYFVTKFGPECTDTFQRARTNLVRSLAAYSIISYLLQFKDRHNGNIMYDDQGYIMHIDFGFCFDIVPGGVKFEAVPFKLTREMVLVMGGNGTQAYRWFEEMCVKGYLACRPHMELIIKCVEPMLESGLPCFKPATMEKLRGRFVPEKSEKDAASHMRALVRKSYESNFTKGYDEFQRITNGIPY